MPNIGLYAVSIAVKCDSGAGAATLEFDLVVHADDGQIYGSGRIKQSIPPPNGDVPIPRVAGLVRHTGLGQDQLLVALSGRYALQGPPTQPIETECRMQAALVVDADWNGVGSFTYGPRGSQRCVKATVTKTK